MKRLLPFFILLSALMILAGCDKVNDEDSIINIKTDFILSGTLKELSDDTPLIGWQVVMVQPYSRQAGRVSYPAYRLVSSGPVFQSGEYKIDVAAYDQSIRDGRITGQGTPEERRDFYQGMRILLLHPDESLPLDGFHEKKYIVPELAFYSLPNLRQLSYSGELEELTSDLKIHTEVTMYKFLLDNVGGLTRRLSFRALSSIQSFQNYSSLPFPYNTQEEKWTVHHALPSREMIEATVLFKAASEENTRIVKDTFLVGGPEEIMVKEYFY